jgi:hypothetical protein
MWSLPVFGKVVGKKWGGREEETAETKTPSLSL